MKRTSIIVLSLIFVSCNPFGEHKVLKYKDDLTYLISKFKEYEEGTYGRDEIDEFIIADIRKMGIDFVVINDINKNPSYSGFVEENDSLIIFIDKADNILDLERRIIYDLKKYPRNFGSDNIIHASYKIVRIDERWYYSEIGFD
ncbi:hypothetical protein [Snuella sedimenti]|uniref:Lipoprotein n=1 Tax=Snuella sedimenti TaxID=2798802 RepID=A0A8J7IHU7_9FLAO|nr:hypothetical protein [Snuella sedimenti]MBJ6368853.1 hypothetical protein [Snuella sedimenti]